MTKILVIEDEVEIRANLVDLLELEDYTVVSAENGINGIVGVFEHQPDVILCDVMMPEIDGYDVLQTIRQEPETALTPFIFLTALADKGDIRQGMLKGADDYLTKPFTRHDVIATVQAQLERQSRVKGTRTQQEEQISELKAEIQQFRDVLNEDQAQLITELRTQLRDSVIKLNIASNILDSLPPGEQRERGLALVNNVCMAEVKLLGRIPNFEHLQPSTAAAAV
ncbi:MAG: response regulator [Cyanobacteria bacterium J06632_22]